MLDTTKAYDAALYKISVEPDVKTAKSYTMKEKKNQQKHDVRN